jgi:hypothetical protein
VKATNPMQATRRNDLCFLMKLQKNTLMILKRKLA